ncbi:enoyl-CoA hydratase [Pelagibius sp.]|uniref:enoyl-CoA hydratase n=1 Tax=Pelagibius sp. TaxID=1931238 RepID=UPI003BB075B2
MTATDELLFEREGAIGVITLNRPQARNALTFAMYERLAELCRDTESLGVKALIVTGAGDKAFAAGTDIAQFRGFTTEQHALDYEAKIDAVLGAVETCPLPTVAAISGACTGGGAAIAAACDLRIASTDLKFGFPIARTLGNCLSVANLARLAALLGAGRTREILFTSRLVGAEEALAAGLISEVLADHDSLMARARALAAQLTEQAPLTLRATKEGLRRLVQPGIEDSDLIVSCYTSEDFREGLEAFLAKRKPNWQGR